MDRQISGPAQPSPASPSVSRPSRPADTNAFCDAYIEWAEEYYKQVSMDHDGERVATREHLNMRNALKPLRVVAGTKDLNDLNADDLYACCDWLLKQRRRDGEPFQRDQINLRIKRIRRAIKWGTEPPRRWISLLVLEDMKLYRPLKRDRSEATEGEPVEPVSWEDVNATLAALAMEGEKKHKSLQSVRLSTMIELCWQTGMRPGEIVRMRKSEIVKEQAKLSLWETTQVCVYQPKEHKTRHHGIDRNIFLGPEAQRLTEDWMRRAKTDRLWNYTVNTFGQAIARVNKRHNLNAWSPNQLRHSFATRMRSQCGIDVVQVLMGHRHRATTEIYAIPDASAAISAILRFG